MLIGAILEIETIELSGNSIYSDDYNSYNGMTGVGVVMSDGTSHGVGVGSGVKTNYDYSNKPLPSIFSVEYKKELLEPKMPDFSQLNSIYLNDNNGGGIENGGLQHPMDNKPNSIPTNGLDNYFREEHLKEDINVIDMSKPQPTIIQETKEVIRHFACAHSDLGREGVKAFGDMVIAKTKIGIVIKATGVAALHEVVDKVFDNFNEKCK